MLEIIQISVIAFTFYILGEPGMIFDWYQKLISNLPEWLWKPLGGCLKCWEGQVAFWYYLIKYFHSYKLVDHLFFVSACILIATTLNYLYERIEKN